MITFSDSRRPFQGHPEPYWRISQRLQHSPPTKAGILIIYTLGVKRTAGRFWDHSTIQSCSTDTDQLAQLLYAVCELSWYCRLGGDRTQTVLRPYLARQIRFL